MTEDRRDRSFGPAVQAAVERARNASTDPRWDPANGGLPVARQDGNWFIAWNDAAGDDFVLRVSGNRRIEFGRSFTKDAVSRMAVEQVFKALIDQMLERPTVESGQ